MEEAGAAAAVEVEAENFIIAAGVEAIEEEAIEEVVDEDDTTIALAVA